MSFGTLERIRLTRNAGSGAAKVSSPGRGYAQGSSSVRRPPRLPPPRYNRAATQKADACWTVPPIWVHPGFSWAER